MFLIQAIATRKELNNWGWFIKSIPFALLGGAMCLLCRLLGVVLGQSVLTLVAQVLFGAVFYMIGVLAIWKLTDNREYLDLVRREILCRTR